MCAPRVRAAGGALHSVIVQPIGATATRPFMLAGRQQQEAPRQAQLFGPPSLTDTTAAEDQISVAALYDAETDASGQLRPRVEAAKISGRCRCVTATSEIARARPMRAMRSNSSNASAFSSASSSIAITSAGSCGVGRHFRSARSKRSLERTSSTRLAAETNFGPAPEPIAAILDIAPETEVRIVARQIATMEGRLLQLSTTYHAPDADRCADEAGESASGAPRRRASRPKGRIEDVVKARMPFPDEVRALRIPAGVPLLTITRITYDVQNRALDVTDLKIPADRHELAYDFR
jgi:hypothetical protein